MKTLNDIIMGLVSEEKGDVSTLKNKLKKATDYADSCALDFETVDQKKYEEVVALIRDAVGILQEASLKIK